MSKSDISPPSAGAHAGDLQPPPGLVTSKIAAPQLRQRTVNRPRLMDRFDQTDAPVVVVVAPAGYGKSVLVRQWLMSSIQPSAWVSLDRFDNDPVSYFSLLTEALASIDERLASVTRRLLAGSNPPDATTLARALSTDLSTAACPITLVIDDYHAIVDPEIPGAMAILLKRLVAPTRLVLISRTLPSLPLARLRSRGELAEIGQDDLRFTDDETVALMRSSDGLQIERPDAEAINRQTERWVAGLRLVGYMLRRQPAEQVHSLAAKFSGTMHEIDSYLWEEVVNLQPPDVRAFLVSISILDRFCASLCQAVSGSDHSATIIRQLERDQLFIVGLDDQGEWFRFHHLFSAALLERLQEEVSEDEIDALHRRAAQWFEAHDLFEEASRHAIAGREWEQAAQLLERISPERFAVDNLEAFCNWLQDVPPEALQRNPGLTYRYGVASIRLGRLERTDQVLSILDRVWGSGDDSSNMGRLLLLRAYRNFFVRPSLCAEIATASAPLFSDDRQIEMAMAHCLASYGHIYSGAVSTAERALDEARVRLGGTRRNWVWQTEQALSGWVLIRRGRLADAASLFEDTIRSSDEHDEIGIPTALKFLGEIKLEQLQFGAAERFLRQARELNERCPSQFIKLSISDTIAELAWARGQLDAAFEELDRAIHVAEQMPSPASRSRSFAQQARFWMASGQTHFAERWARSCGLDPSLPLVPDWQYEHLTLVRWFLLSEQISEARRLVDAVAEHATEQGQHGDLVEILLLRALIRAREDDIDGAVSDLNRSLELGDGGGFLRVFVKDIEALRPLLHHKTVLANHGAYIQRILRAGTNDHARLLQPSRGVSGTLSRREVEVLGLVAKGLSNREIGDRLFISEKTVKRHLSSIYGKLSVANRVQAIERGRQTGLLDSSVGHPPA